MIIFELANNNQHAENTLQLMPLYYQEDHLDFELEKAQVAVQALIKHSDYGQLWLIRHESSNQYIGYMALGFGFSLECGGRDAFVDELFVSKEFRGKSFGSQAIEHAIKECAKVGIAVLRLEVTRNNLKALRLYKKLGFVDYQRFLLTRLISPNI